MIDELIIIVTIGIRVLFLVLFTGAYLWFVIAFGTGTRLLPPPQRIALLRGVERRFLLFSWLYVVVMSIGGLGSMLSLGGAPTLGTILSTPRGQILGLEVVVSLLIIVCNSLIHFLYLPRLKATPISSVESSDKSLKWLTAKNNKTSVGAISSIYIMSIANIVLGVIAIALGVLFSNL